MEMGGCNCMGPCQFVHQYLEGNIFIFPLDFQHHSCTMGDLYILSAPLCWFSSGCEEFDHGNMGPCHCVFAFCTTYLPGLATGWFFFLCNICIPHHVTTTNCSLATGWSSTIYGTVIIQCPNNFLLIIPKVALWYLGVYKSLANSWSIVRPHTFGVPGDGGWQDEG